MSITSFSLEHPAFRDRTGNGVRIGVIDSGVHAANPHITATVSGINLTGQGQDDDFVDRLGHGTAVSAAILEKAPGAQLFVIRVFERTLSTSAGVLAQAIERAANNGCRLINLSLGTQNPERTALLHSAVQHAAAYGAIVVSAAELEGVMLLPGSLPGASGVLLDRNCPRHEIRIAAQDSASRFCASGYPRPIPGVPPERNLQGISFAVANVTGMLARLLESHPDLRSPTDLFDVLKAGQPW